MNIIKSEERLGTIGYNKYGSKMIVQEYNSPIDITVRFIETGNTVHTTWLCFTKGSVRNVYDRTVFGIGYTGEGNYPVSIDRMFTKQYIRWNSMLSRCYNEKSFKKLPTYKECSVAEEWHNFQNFAKWFDENYYEIKGEKMCLDKDILIKGNKLYSPDTCVFVTHSINTLVINRKANRGDLPVGVYFDTSKNTFEAKCSVGTGKQVRIGYFDSKEKAFNAYKNFKEQVIKSVAIDHKGKIPIKLFEALMNYKIDITD